MACSPPLAGARPEQGERWGREEPGERRAAQTPWREEQAEPRASGRSASPGLPVRRRLAADAPEERCGGKGFAPAGAAASWERRPGPSGVQRVVNTQRTAGDKTGEWQLRAQAALGQDGDLWCEDECILDYEEASLEEGELVDDSDEDIWWEQGGVGPLMLFLSLCRVRGRCSQFWLERHWREPRWCGGRHRSGHHH
ncbi:hypothetical protein NDU88_004266 [Pleurodeles waltl]|uniref:Uncharacterized protein n=1 Tax=Pleurodeles waltl TaxID=8319 RepID=A0AAV7M6L7_PLEWA|nr:hypothetical protein NDU88_004266 [Pleurodeles waltl]